MLDRLAGRAGPRRARAAPASPRRSFFRGRRAVLILGDEGYRLLRFQGRRLVEAELWPCDETGRRDAVERLHRLAGCRLTVLVDSIEQTYRREELPAGNVFDRRRIVDRRLDIAFPSMALRRAIRLRAEDGNGKGRQRYLFAALPGSDELTSWCRALAAIDRPVAGLGLLPLEIAARAQTLRRLTADGPVPAPTTDSWLLVVGREATGGVRQIVLHHDELALTRLANSLPAALPAAAAAQIQRDLGSTLGYLARMGYERGSPLTILVLADEALGQELLALEPPAPGVGLRLLTPARALEALGIEAPSLPADTPWADPVFAALVAGQPLHLPFATPDMSRRTRAWQGLRALRAAAALALVALGAMAAHDVARRFEAVETRARLSVGRGELEARLGEQRLDAESEGTDLATIRRIARARERLEPVLDDHEVMLTRLVASLSPEIRLTRLRWQRDEVDGTVPGRGVLRDRPVLPPLDTTRRTTLALTVDLSRVENLDRAVGVTEAFAATLGRQFPDHVVDIERHAVDILPGQALAGGIGGRSLQEITRGAMTADILIRAESP